MSRERQRGYFDGCFSTAEIERQLERCELRWTEELDAAKYAGGTRTTHNGEGVARAADVWALGCLAYELCSLRPPFLAANQLALARKILCSTPAPLPACHRRLDRTLAPRACAFFIRRSLTPFLFGAAARGRRTSRWSSTSS